MSAATTTEPTNADVFASAAEKAAEMSEYLGSKEALGQRHEELEDYAEREGREWIRRILQGHYDLRGAVERVVRPRGMDGVLRTFLRPTAGAVIRDAFEQARRRDPRFERTWVVLVDGNRDPLRLVKKAVRKLGVSVTLVVDLIHVIEYLWKAAYAFHEDGSKEAEQWVQQRLMWLLQGETAKVSDNLRRNARAAHLEGPALKSVTRCLRYLRGVRDYLGYAHALEAGLPIATGVIEGACRYLVKDRMERTGARWSLVGAEAVLQLRALRASGDFDDYWVFHLEREHQRNHLRRHADGVAPAPLPALKPRLQRMK